MTHDSSALPDRFWTNVDPNGPVGIHSQTGETIGRCWLWTAGQNGKGYGLWMSGSRADGTRRHAYPYRSTYETLVGSIAEGLVLDHLCRVPLCCNPLHVEPVTDAVNLARGENRETLGAMNAAKTHCPAGHQYDASNTRLVQQTGGGPNRQCRTCHNAEARARRARKRAEAKASPR